MFGILFILNGFIVGGFLFLLIEQLFGDKPLVRLSKLLAGIFAGIGYFMLCAAINASDVSLFIGCIIIFGPLALVALLWIIDYMFKKK